MQRMRCAFSARCRERRRSVTCCLTKTVILRERGVSGTPQLFDPITTPRNTGSPAFAGDDGWGYGAFVLCEVAAASSRNETMTDVPKLALDFLLRPATMTSRQHSGTTLSTRRGKPARRRQHHCCVEGPVWRYGSCAGCSARSAKNSPVFFRAEAPPALEEWEHQQMIVETTCCARENVRMR